MIADSAEATYGRSSDYVLVVFQKRYETLENPCLGAVLNGVVSVGDDPKRAYSGADFSGVLRDQEPLESGDYTSFDIPISALVIMSRRGVDDDYCMVSRGVILITK